VNVLAYGLNAFALGALLTALRLGWHMTFKLDRYDWRYSRGNILLTFAVWVALWPLLFTGKPRLLLDPTDLFFNAHADAVRARLRDNPPPCGTVIRYRDDGGLVEKAYGEFLFSAEAVERVLTHRLHENPPLAICEAEAILNWIRHRDSTLSEPTDVPVLWEWFEHVADVLIRAGVGEARCRKCDEAFATGELIPVDDEGGPTQVVNKLTCPRGHNLLAVEIARLLCRPSSLPSGDARIEIADHGYRPRSLKYRVSSQQLRLDESDRRTVLSTTTGDSRAPDSMDSHATAGDKQPSPDFGEARKRALDFLSQGYGESIALVPVQSCPTPVYGFDPKGWHLFAVTEGTAHRTGATRYVAVSKSTGEVRSLGLLGQ